MGLPSYGQRQTFKGLLAQNQESALEDLAVATKCVINCGRTHFRVKHLKEEFGPEDPWLPPLNSNLLEYSINTLVGKGLLEEERKSEPTYIVRDFRKLRAFYEQEVKPELPTTFVRDVLEERV